MATGCRRRPPFWGVVGVITFLALVLAVFTGFAVMRSANEHERTLFYTMITKDMAQQLTALVDQLFYRFRLITGAMYDLEPLLQTCSIPDSNYSGELLARIFNAMDDAEQPLGSLGIIRRDSVNTAKYGAPSKWSWQVAAGFGCPDIIWAVCDPVSYPNFTGTCAFPNNGSLFPGPPIYQGEDWGLKPEEAYLLLNASTGSEVVLPVFSLLNSLTLTYEVSIPSCSGDSTAPYALLFAEQSLQKLGTVVESISGSFDDSIIVLLEHTSKLLLASNIANQTHVGDQRLHVSNVSDARLREIFTALDELMMPADNRSLSSENYWISQVHYQRNGVDWLLLSALPQRSLLTFIREASSISIGISIALVVVLPALIMLATYCLISRPIMQFKDAPRKTSSSSSSGTHYTNEIDTLYNRIPSPGNEKTISLEL